MRCTLRLAARGIYVDGDPTSEAEAIAICKRRAGAMVALEDDAPRDQWRRVEAALRREGIAIHMRGPIDDRECMDNPLAKGCP
jgi:hypothetical protein